MPRDYIDQSPTAFQRRPHLTQDDHWIRAFLKEAKIGHIASSFDGQPFINPTMFWLDEENHQIVFHSNVAGRGPPKNLRKTTGRFGWRRTGRITPYQLTVEVYSHIPTP